MDGYVRLWFWETVESSVPADGTTFVEVEPIYEVKVGDEGCQLMGMVRDESKEDSQLWYAQDGNGGIWSCQISATGGFGGNSKQLYRCHAGAIVGVVASPFNSFVATFGEDGRLHLYNYEKRELVFQRQFKAKGSAICWASLKVGNNLILGFSSGVIRVMVVEFKEGQVKGLKLIQKLKSHTRLVTQMSFNGTGEIFVTGSEDHSVFVHGVKRRRGECLELFPIGMICLTSIVTAISWNVFNTPYTVLIGCRFGEIYEVELPVEEQGPRTELSYELKDLPMRCMRFRSIKSEVRRLIKVKDYWYKKTFDKKKWENVEVIKSDDDEVDSHFVPPIPNKILGLRAMERDIVWVFVAQFDAGYIYEYQFGKEGDIDDVGECLRVIPVPDAMNLEINAVIEDG